MYIEKLTIKKFRSIEYLAVEFNKGVNIIVGENNVGKTTIIDAIRICLSLGKQWRDIGVKNPEDFYIDGSVISDILEPIEFTIEFKIEEPEDRNLFHSLLWQDPAGILEPNLKLNFYYDIEKDVRGNEKLKWKVWGGHDTTVEMPELQQIYYSYLEPLRNAEQELRPYAINNKVTSLFRDMTSYEKADPAGAETISLTHEKKHELSQAIEKVLQNDDWTGLISTGQSFINEHLEKSDIKKKSSKVHLKLLEYKYDNIVKGLLTRKPVYSESVLGMDLHLQKYFDISQNGLGDNNIILASTVLGDLKSRRDQKIEHYYALLIEEPEAHLHPQRQNTFFNYLNTLQDLGVQIFISSHSPTITAKSNLDNLLILQRDEAQKTSFFTTRKSVLTDRNKDYLRKFLDVTKSQLFFASGCILVEGISEALLLPIFAKITGKDYDLDKNGIEIVNINGVAFEPFANLFNATDKEKRLATYCSIITDDDKSIIKSGNFINKLEGINKIQAGEVFKELKILKIIDQSNRIVDFDAAKPLKITGFETKEVFIKSILSAKFNKLSDRASNAKKLENKNLRVELANHTFEYELITADDYNARLIARIYNDMHSKKYVDVFADKHVLAMDILKKLKSNKDKSVLAENIAYVLEKKPGMWKHFIVPSYLQNSIRWVIDKKV
ncbi:AAA family ATPase [Flavobacterium johnsoniae]|uniref:ATP-dependent nuclease n=1 Tax=Flavobacterium johnsoniae TaxID=986 RepID=UPI0025B1C456|nr:AAA family ATPase [Flavobacterium johnsoniae]WJS93369.1 AAA family ATPase [Flavobacterium johnsoniae]